MGAYIRLLLEHCCYAAAFQGSFLHGLRVAFCVLRAGWAAGLFRAGQFDRAWLSGGYFEMDASTVPMLTLIDLFNATFPLLDSN